MLKIWGRTNSINVQKVLWTCAELNLPYERIDAGMQFGVNNTPEYRAMNPNGLVPLINDNGFVLWNPTPSCAIWRASTDWVRYVRRTRRRQPMPTAGWSGTARHCGIT